MKNRIILFGIIISLILINGCSSCKEWEQYEICSEITEIIHIPIPDEDFVFNHSTHSPIDTEVILIVDENITESFTEKRYCSENSTRIKCVK